MFTIVEHLFMFSFNYRRTSCVMLNFNYSRTSCSMFSSSYSKTSRFKFSFNQSRTSYLCSVSTTIKYLVYDKLSKNRTSYLHLVL